MTSSKDFKSDLQADLLADLAPPTAELPAARPMPVLPPDLTTATPALTLAWTPLRWSRPRVVRADKGPGKALKIGPFKVELSVRD